MRSSTSLLLLLAAVPAAAQQAPVADSTRVYELAEVEVLPRPQNVPDFTAALRDGYPPHLREAGVGGTVQVAFVVGPDGAPGDVRVLATPDSGFNAPTVQAVALLRFSPAQLGGRAVAVRVEQPITWRVEAPVAAQAAREPEAEDGLPAYELRDVEELPRPLNVQAFVRALAQSYPRALRDAGTQGVVQVRFRVNEDGSISHARITHSTDTQFNVPTLAALQVLRFRPAKVGGRPVRAWVEQPVQWSIGGDSPAFMPPRYEPDRGRFRPPPNPCSVSQC